MPREAKYAFSRSRTGSTLAVGPPCTNTTYGGSSPSGAATAGDVGGYTSACTTGAPGAADRATCRGTGRYAGSTVIASRRSTSNSERTRPSVRTTPNGVAGPPAVATTVVPEAVSPEKPNARSAPSSSPASASFPEAGSRYPSRIAPIPCSTASVPSPSTTNGRAPSCHAGPANSSSRGHSGRGVAPATAGTAYRFHQPEASEATYRVWSSAQAGASTDSVGPPITSVDSATVVPVTGPTRSSVPSHGMRGWSQLIQASRVPSGDGVGKARKSAPVTSTRTAEGSSCAVPSSGTATIARVIAGSCPSCPAECASRTHQTSRPSGDRVMSA